jgi:hypothetical protein
MVRQRWKDPAPSAVLLEDDAFTKAEEPLEDDAFTRALEAMFSIFTLPCSEEHKAGFTA